MVYAFALNRVAAAPAISVAVNSVGLSVELLLVNQSTFLCYHCYMMIKQTDFAYIAGYIDGDGCFYIGKYKPKNRLKHKYIVSIVISSVNKHVLESFKKKFGGSVTLVKQEHDNCKALYHFSIAKRNTLKLARSIEPYLIEKKEECLTAIQFASSNDIGNIEECLNKMAIIKDVSNLVSKYHKKEFEAVRNTVNPSEVDFAYLAGFIDAECCLGIQKYRIKNKPNFIYKIQLQCNNTKSPIFKWLLERFGGQIHFVNRAKYERYRNQLVWRLTGKALSQILDKIYPFLKHKKPVCGELMKFYTTTLLNGGARHTETFRNQYMEVLKIREEIVAKVHLLNLKGIKTISGG